MRNYSPIALNHMALQSSFFRTYAAPLKVNGAFMALIIGCFTMLILSFGGRERYGWVYPLFAALLTTIVALFTNIFLAIIMAGKNQRNTAIAYVIAAVPYVAVFLFFWSIAGQMHIGKLEGG